jgi:hypothetical protein
MQRVKFMPGLGGWASLQRWWKPTRLLTSCTCTNGLILGEIMFFPCSWKLLMLKSANLSYCGIKGMSKLNSKGGKSNEEGCHCTHMYMRYQAADQSTSWQKEKMWALRTRMSNEMHQIRDLHSNFHNNNINNKTLIITSSQEEPVPVHQVLPHEKIITVPKRYHYHN